MCLLSPAFQLLESPVSHSRLERFSQHVFQGSQNLIFFPAGSWPLRISAWRPRTQKVDSESASSFNSRSGFAQEFCRFLTQADLFRPKLVFHLRAIKRPVDREALNDVRRRKERAGVPACHGIPWETIGRGSHLFVGQQQGRGIAFFTPPVKHRFRLGEFLAAKDG